MPFRFTVDTRSGVVFTVATGSISPDEALAVREAIRAAPGFSPTMHALVDLRQARLGWSHSSLRRLGSDSPFSAMSRRAFVVSDDLHYGLCRVYAALSDEDAGEARPFRSLEEACAWIDTPLQVALGALVSPGLADGTSGE